MSTTETTAARAPERAPDGGRSLGLPSSTALVIGSIIGTGGAGCRARRWPATC